MKLLSLLLFGLGLLTLVLVVLGLWMDCSPADLMRHVRTLVQENLRRQAMEREDRVVVQRLQERARVMDALAAGTMSLFEAAECFQRIGLPRKAALDYLSTDFPTDEAGWCRKVLRSIRSHLGQNPSRCAHVLPPLVKAYRERFGALPVDLERELRGVEQVAPYP